MRILAIRGRNLASLAGDFEVDFQSEPLASAGVFAISGPTGAGKSTLLDAMCLALYHDTPRLRSAKEAQIAVPDIKDQTLTPQDPRHLLRRGCGEGHAEVDFEDQSGVSWRARWSVARARGKVGGRLQPAQVSLLRIADQQPVAGSVREVQEQLATLTGLSFEQFCRSVLLAQNDFAALLKARQEERAGLLEALTGTEIFSQISKLAHQRNHSEQQQLRALEQQLGQHPPMSDEARAELTQQRAAALEAGDVHAQRLQALVGEAAWHDRGAAIDQQLQQSAARLSELEGELATDARLGLQLRYWAAAAALRHLADSQQRTAAEALALGHQLPQLQQEQQRAQQASEAAERASRGAADALSQAEQARARAQPQIQAARAADVQIELARAAAAQAERELERARTTQSELKQQLAARALEHDQHQILIDEHRRWLQLHPHLPGDEGPWAALGQRLQSLIEHRQRETAARGREQALQRSLASEESRLLSLRESTDQAAAALQQRSTEVRAAEQQLEELDAPALAARQRQWLAEDRAATQVQQWLDACQERQQALLQLQQQGEQLQQTRQTLDQQAHAAAEHLQQAANEAQAAHTALQRVSLVADAHTEQLRTLLVAGEPCPVCGALEHPQAGQHSAEVRALLDELEAQAAAARQAHQQAIAGDQRTRSQLDAASQRLLEIEESLRHADQALVQSQADLLSAAASLWPEVDDAAAVAEWLPQRQQELAEQQARLELAQTRLEQTQSTLKLAREAEHRARAELQHQQAAVEQLQADIAPTRHALTLLQGELGAIDADLRSGLMSLRELLPAIELNADDHPPLLSDWQQGEQLRSAAKLALQSVREIAQALATLQQQLDAAAQAQTLAAEGRERAAAALQQVIEDRRTLLSHENTEAFAAALDQAVAAARAQQQQRAEEQSRCLQQHTAATAELQSAQRQLSQLQGRAEQQQQQLEQEWTAQLQADQLDPAPLQQLWDLLAELPADLGARQQAWAARLQALGEIRSQLEVLHKEQTQWQQQAGSARDSTEVQADLEATRQLRDQSLQQIGAIDQQLKEDEHRQKAAAEQLSQLQQRRIEAARWVMLDQLIGAADGSKFKRYAQQYTLEVLLEYANQHLARLSPRYRLRRGLEALSLLVIDSDLGDEVRTVHSLSGGETFLVSLALALGLASLSSQRVRVESLFIDEGFGSLDAATLNTAMEALDRLQSEGRRVGVISHVHDMAERIGVQIRVEPVAPGKSRVRVAQAGEPD
ncbi:MAG: AAA family ATPase [Lysobacterales bacterium]